LVATDFHRELAADFFTTKVTKYTKKNTPQRGPFGGEYGGGHREIRFFTKSKKLEKVCPPDGSVKSKGLTLMLATLGLVL
jgi:hypothetical protein